MTALEMLKVALAGQERAFGKRGTMLKAGKEEQGAELVKREEPPPGPFCRAPALFSVQLVGVRVLDPVSF